MTTTNIWVKKKIFGRINKETCNIVKENITDAQKHYNSLRKDMYLSCFNFQSHQL